MKRATYLLSMALIAAPVVVEAQTMADPGPAPQVADADTAATTAPVVTAKPKRSFDERAAAIAGAVTAGAAALKGFSALFGARQAAARAVPGAPAATTP